MYKTTLILRLYAIYTYVMYEAPSAALAADNVDIQQLC